ncbi:class I SAM-dependent methyltransferase, partial [Vibrio sp. 10N.222.49.F1]
MPNPTKPQMKPLIRKSHTYDQKASSDLGSAHQEFQVPTNLVQHLWFRSRESLADDGLVYDPIAAQAC